MSALPVSVLADKAKKLGTTHSWWLPAPTPVDGETWGLRRRRYGVKYSESHVRSPDGKYREGGPFFTLRFATRVESSKTVVVFRKNEGRAYTGSFGVPIDAPNLYDYSYMSMHGLTTANIVNNMDAYSAQARWMLRPDRPDFSPLVSLGELLATNLENVWLSYKQFNKRYRAELRRKAQSRIFLNRVGKYHLAIQFGLMPVVQDVLKFIEAFQGADKRFEQLIRDNGKGVRRRVKLLTMGVDSAGYKPPVDNWKVVEPTPWHPHSVPSLKSECYVEGQHAKSENSYTRTVEVWAVGKSRYWLPGYEGNKHSKYLENLKRRIYSDLEWNFDTLYNLIPWSWFLDYFLNFGSFFKVFGGGLSEGNFVFDYAYIMRKETHEDKTVITEQVYLGPESPGTVSYTILRQGVLKSRYAASLFGWGFTEEDLSPFQWAIMGALGLSSL